jgi:hypothetical protein
MKQKELKSLIFVGGKLIKWCFSKKCKLGLTLLKNSINSLRVGCGDLNASTTSNR